MKKPTDKARALVNSFYGASITWSTSRARDTYGYNVATLHLLTWSGGSHKAARCTGGGYDMTGTCFGDWMQVYFAEDLKKLSSDLGSNTPWNTRGTFYGLSFWDPARRKYRKTYRPGYILSVDGGCGLSSMEHILNALGVTLTRGRSTARETIYLFDLIENKIVIRK